jgi:3-dehydroquinate synthase
METIYIQLEDRSYPIYIGEGLLTQIKLIESHLKQKHVAIVTNTTVAPLYLNSLLHGLKQHGIKAFPIILPDGEVYKNQETLNLIYDALLKEKCERTTTL